MRSHILIGLGLTFAITASAAEHRNINPLAIYGRWLGAPGAAPENCDADGFVVSFGSTDGKTFLMTVQHRVNGIMPLDGKKTEYDVAPMPASAPATVDVYLLSKDGQDLGVHVKTGSALELLPSGPDKTFPAVSLVLARCGA